MSRKETLKFDKYEIVLDPENLRFDEQSLSDYIIKEGSHYDWIGANLALSERNLQNKESAFDRLYCERFVEAKEEGSSDKLAEAKAKCDPAVVDLKEEISEAKYCVNRLKRHLMAWDKNHDNAQSLGHMQRKLMDKLGCEISHSFTPVGSGREVPGLDREIESTCKPFNSGGGFDELTSANMY